MLGFIPFRNKRFLNDTDREEGRRVVVTEFEPVLIENRKHLEPENAAFIFPPKNDSGWEQIEVASGHFFNKWRAHVEHGASVPVGKCMGQQSLYKMMTMA